MLSRTPILVSSLASTSRASVSRAGGRAIVRASALRPPPTSVLTSCSFVTEAARRSAFEATRITKYAESTTPQSSLNDPTELEAQKALEEGTTRLEAGDWEGSKEAYERSLSIMPTSSAHFNLGVVHFRLSDLPAAIASFEACLKLSPEASDAYTNLASCYVMSSPPRPDLAVEHLQKATSLDPRDGESWFNLAAVLEACERLEESVKAYEKSIELGIDRAEENKRNCVAKILAARLAVVGEEEKRAKEAAQSAEQAKAKDS